MGKPFLQIEDNIMLDPDLADTFVVLQRKDTVGTNGRTVITSTKVAGQLGIFCTASRNDLERLDDEQRMGRHMSVVTKFRLQGPSPGRQPDIVQWNGSDFIVQFVDLYTNYGPGFIQAIIGSIDSIDPSP